MLVLETSSPSNSPTATSTSTTIASTNSLSMLTSGSNQYIQPDYLSPLPMTLDTKRSPLALLAQTCSQIGADPTPSTTLNIPPTSGTHQPAKVTEKPAPTKKPADHQQEKSRSNSKTPPTSGNAKREPEPNAPSKVSDETAAKSSGFKSPTSKSASGNSAASPVTSAPSSVQHPLFDLPKDMTALGAFRPSPVFPGVHPGLSGLYPQLPYDALAAFRHPAYYPPPVSSLGFSLASYQQALQSSYSRMGSGKGAEVPPCRDPYCTGCPASAAAPPSTSNAHGSNSPGSTCPAGCTQCDHQKTATATRNSPIAPSPSVTASTTATASATVSPGSASRPYVCNWIVAHGDGYCGKRFTSSEELLQHLRTHTSVTSEPLTSASSYSPALLPHSHLLASSAALHRTYPTPPLSPLSAARYHPYAKPSGPVGAPIVPPSSVSASNPLLSLHHPATGYPSLPHPSAALSAYYSHPAYSAAALYSQRMLGVSGVLP